MYRNKEVLLSHSYLKLFAISFLGLFLQLLIIRWVAIEINIFAYLQNSLLIICFLGLGLGFLTCRNELRLIEGLISLAIFCLLVAIPITNSALRKISPILAYFDDMAVWNRAALESPIEPIFVIIVAILVIFILWWFLIQAFIPIGQITGRLLSEHPNPIKAYSVNVVASLIGSWAFLVYSYMGFSPWVWFLTFALCLITTIPQARSLKSLFFIGVILISAFVFSTEPGAEKTIWSHYQKLTLHPYTENKRDDEKLIAVNNCGYQVMIDLSKNASVADRSSSESSQIGLSQYDLPFVFHKSPKKALILGAGSGNDVAGAIRAGVPDISAVEIDRAIIELGRAFHPERPYESNQVRLINDDARSYLQNSRETYDVISFGLLDSHTNTSVTNARLDHYVYTKEAIQAAHKLLSQNGILSLTFESQKPYISDRMARLLRDEFGQEPLYFRIPYNTYGWGGVMFIAGDLKQANEVLKMNFRLADKINQWKAEYPVTLTYTTNLTTDDWPYIYLNGPQVPSLFIIAALIILALLKYSLHRLDIDISLRGWTKLDWQFFLLGASFMLLELQGINMGAVVLGSTWWVSAVIISGILIMVLAANFAYYYIPCLKRSGLTIYIALLACCALLYFVDLSYFSDLPKATRVIVVSFICTLPLFFSGIVFIRSFEASTKRDRSMAINLFGAIFGGMLQALTFLLGIKALIVLVAIFYSVAYICRPISMERI